MSMSRASPVSGLPWYSFCLSSNCVPVWLEPSSPKSESLAKVRC